MMKLPWRSASPTYNTTRTVRSQVQPGVSFTVRKISFGGRVELMTRIRELARRMEFLAAGDIPERMDARLIQAQIDREYVTWGVTAVSGLVIDRRTAGPELLPEGPEDLFREALAIVRKEVGLTDQERKNC